MPLVRSIKLDEDERQMMLDLRSRQEAMELFIASGSPHVVASDMQKYKKILDDVNEMKRNLLQSAGELDESMFDYTYYFDTVAGMLWVEDAE